MVKRGWIAEGWEKALLTAGSTDTAEREGQRRGSRRKQGGKDGATAWTGNERAQPIRAIIHSWTERGSWIRRCTRARFRRIGGALRGNSRPRRVSPFYPRDHLVFLRYSPFFPFLIDQSSIVCLKKFVPVEKNIIKFCVDRDRIELRVNDLAVGLA